MQQIEILHAEFLHFQNHARRGQTSMFQQGLESRAVRSALDAGQMSGIDIEVGQAFEARRARDAIDDMHHAA
ncbi:MAG: hypothetical protein H6R19_2775 [Proteobacteria bacterium]|nr:hypothetical protein [Pseudomonadota bacterium]